MATPPPSKQLFIIDGDLQLTTKPSVDGSTLGRITFKDNTSGELGALKIFGGGPGNYRLVLDTSKVLRGTSFRTTAGQGSTQEGGTNLPYTMDVQSNYIALRNNCIIEPMEARWPGGDFAGTLLRISKPKDSVIQGYSNMVDVYMSTFLPNQAILMEIGQSSSYGVGLGYKNPVGGGNSTQSYGFLSHRQSTTPYQKEVLKFYRDGNVDIPIRLDVGTISATTYLNLPPLDILPITLDTTNNRVGINQTTPGEALDVTGNVHVSDHLTVDGSITGQLTTAVQPGITGVGVLAGLNVSGTVDITGDVTASGNVQVNGTIRSDIGIYPTGIANSVIQSGSGSPEGVKTAIPGSLFLRTDGAVGNQLYTKVTGTGNTGWNVVGGGNSALSFQMPADVTFAGNVALMSFTLPTAGTWQLTISLRSSTAGTIIFYISDVEADTSISIPNKIRCTLLYSGSNLSPSHGVFTYTTTVNSQTVYLNVVGSGSTTYYSNSGYVYALKLV